MSALIFDTETHHSVAPKLIEAAGIVLGDPQVIDLRAAERFEQRYNPGVPSTLGALATHHILDSELVGCPSPDTFALPAGTAYLIGHNVDFDWQVIGQPEVKRICTLAIARRLWPALDSHKLGALAYYLLGDAARDMLKAAHSAASDCETTRHLLRHMVSAARKLEGVELETWEELWAFSEAARIPTVISFGKHKGTPVGDLPPDYVSWLLGQPDIDPYLRKALTK